MPFDIERVFGPEKFTSTQLELVREVRSKFLQLGLDIQDRINNNDQRENGFVYLKEALYCFERAISQGGFLTPESLADAYRTIEDTNRRVTYVWMNARTFSDIRKFGRDILS
jgi:chromosome condensin MukBEF ATPase and DNA-binding subunit MukB